jgi:protein-tyrosine kinase
MTETLTLAASATTGALAREGFFFTDDALVLTQPGGPQAESIATLRTHLLAQHIGDGRRSLAICAAEDGAGGTFLATNLAAAFALAGVNTLLIDGNLRRPALQDWVIATEPRLGLGEYLANDTLRLSDCIQHAVLPNLSVFYAGQPADNAPELMATRRFTEAMDDCMRSYDLTIVDTPPLSQAADIRRIATTLRYALVVARKDASTISDMRRLCEELRADRAKVIGSFLNDY